MLSALAQYDVVWKSPGRDSRDSMPLGNGDIGLNLWVEEGGGVLFYISKTDAFDENNRLVKLGRVRITLSPNPFDGVQPFEQTLDLLDGEVVIRGGDTVLQVWVDANQPVVRFEMDSLTERQVTAQVELLRPEPRPLQGLELDSAYDMLQAPHAVMLDADTLVEQPFDRVVWYHHNQHSIWRETLQLQGLDSLVDQLQDPLQNRIFGAWMQANNLKHSAPLTLASQQPLRQVALTVTVLSAPGADAPGWLKQIDALAVQTSGDIETARAAHRRWWQAFWERSWIFVSGDPEAEEVSRGYVLQRYINACAGRGVLPIKFNGSIFTFDYRSERWNGSQMVPEDFGADYRRWGGPYWYQNTRLPYHSMLKAGDFEMMQALFGMYTAALPLALARTPLYFQHDGAFFPETMDFWGTYANSNFGWDRTGLKTGEVVNTYIGKLWSGGLELIDLMLDYVDYTGDESFLKETLLPLAAGLLRFYDQHFPWQNGFLRLEPAQAIETYQRVADPLPDIAGLHTTLERLLALPNHHIGELNRHNWARLRREVPALPRQGTPEGTVLSAAGEFFEAEKNCENPELYAIFPFRMFGIGRPDLDLALRTFAARKFKTTGGWQQDAIQAAGLGLTAEARQMVVKNFTTHDATVRFPAFWGPNFDWMPDQDHGAVSMIALQAMLMQPVGREMHLFPAWPKDWAVSFRLHAPYNTLITGEYREGELIALDVTPPKRRKDIILHLP
jgi:alpha-L-fucosidase 2